MFNQFLQNWADYEPLTSVARCIKKFQNKLNTSLHIVTVLDFVFLLVHLRDWFLRQSVRRRSGIPFDELARPLVVHCRLLRSEEPTSSSRDKLAGDKSPHSRGAVVTGRASTPLTEKLNLTSIVYCFVPGFVTLLTQLRTNFPLYHYISPIFLRAMFKLCVISFDWRTLLVIQYCCASRWDCLDRIFPGLRGMFTFQ